MNRNQKIALGCGGAGCLGLIVVAIAACAVYFLVYRSPRATRISNININVNTNRNYNSNDNSDLTTNRNDNENENENASNSNSSSSSLSEDDKHKLYYAAGVTGDAELIRRVSVKIGIMDEDFTPGANYYEFIRDSGPWAMRNSEFVLSINTPEKARAYLNEHLD
jgi:hypothetical protein